MWVVRSSFVPVLPVLFVWACGAQTDSVNQTAAAGGSGSGLTPDASVISSDAASNLDAAVDASTTSTVGSVSAGHTTTGSSAVPGTSAAAGTSAPPDNSAPSKDASAPIDGSSATTDAGADAGEASNGACEPNESQCHGNSPEICDADRIWRPLLACEEPLRCSAGQCLPALTEECPILPTLPRFTGTQVVDGDDAEFGDVPAVSYALRNAPVGNASYSAMLPTEVTVRMAWTPSALVAHVRVTDPAVQTYQGEILEYYWQGDNVQFFIAPTDLLTGKYSGTEDGGATHLVIVPPAGGQLSRAIEVYEPCYACVTATPSSVSYAARTTVDGYEIELAWPWSAPSGPLAAGERVSLNLIVGASDTPNTGLELEGLLANNPVSGDTPCGVGTHPGCDDRTWCFSTLE